MSYQRSAWGLGLATYTDGGQVLDVWYPSPQLGAAPETRGPYDVPAELAVLAGADPARGVRLRVVRTVIDLDAAPADAADAYLRLHLLSHRLVRPHGQNLDGLFGVLSNVVWTSAGRSMANMASRITPNRRLRSVQRRRGVSRCRGNPSKVSNNTSNSAAALVSA